MEVLHRIPWVMERRKEKEGGEMWGGRGRKVKEGEGRGRKGKEGGGKEGKEGEESISSSLSLI